MDCSYKAKLILQDTNAKAVLDNKFFLKVKQALFPGISFSFHDKLELKYGSEAILFISPTGQPY